MPGWFTTVARRLRAVLPARWFADETPVLDAVLAGLGAGTEAVLAQIAYAGTQTRLATVNGPWLDFASLDFKGGTVPRRLDEPDDAYRARLLPILPDRATRPDLEARLRQLTGQPFWVFEPMRPADVGGYGVARAYGQAVRRAPRYIGENPPDGAGRYGSLALPFQLFIRLRRVPGSALLDADYDLAIAQMLPIAVTAWTSLDPDPPVALSNTAPLDAFALGQNALA